MRLSNPQAIRALAHPVRLDLIEALGGIGPATAAQCGRAIGVSQASCSFHLRQLAKYGFVEEAGPGPDRRERRWRLTDRHLGLGAAGEVDPEVTRQLSRIVVEREMRRVLDWVERAPSEPVEWREAARGMAATVRVTAAEAAEIKAAWHRVLEPYLARDAAEAGAAAEHDRRQIRYFMAASPLPHHQTGDTDEHAEQD
ncbi:helix-turn-helix domain-containing protein [Kitasatospora sp. NPDC002227]|uniref:ArsR/SmtB family transcription factor n=1 Tax=Kitasatospora sp. NPDC002227 TaxID=3154773 RepID=UPI00331F49FD